MDGWLGQKMRDAGVEDPLDLPLDWLELSVRAHNGLENAGCLTVRDICGKTERELMAVRYVGRKSVMEIREVIGGMGYSLKCEHCGRSG